MLLEKKLHTCLNGMPYVFLQIFHSLKNVTKDAVGNNYVYYFLSLKSIKFILDKRTFFKKSKFSAKKNSEQVIWFPFQIVIYHFFISKIFSILISEK